MVPKLKAKLQVEAQQHSNSHEEVLPHMKLCTFFLFVCREMKPLCGHRGATTLGHWQLLCFCPAH